MLGLQPQSQQTRCIFQLYPNGRASYHAHHRARPRTRKTTRPDTPSTRPKHFLAKNERLVTPPLEKRGCAPSTALVTTPVIPATERPHPHSPGRSVTNLSFLAKIAMRRTRRAERCRPAPPHPPPACAASPKTQGSPRPSPERFRRRGRRPREPPEAVSRAAAMRRGQAKGKVGGFPVGVKGSAKP